MKVLDRIPLFTLLILTLLLGLAPMTPEPHVLEKLRLLASGALSRPIDVFDLLLHATPWLLLGAKLVRMATRADV